VELPYTLVQDYTLISILGETTPKLWFEKVEFIKEYNGMALLNSHPDYLKDRNSYRIYAEFLESMKKKEHIGTLYRGMSRTGGNHGPIFP
jgi:hypothetical protein